MAKGEQKSNREKKKPKKDKVKTNTAAPSQKSVGNVQSGYGRQEVASLEAGGSAQTAAGTPGLTTNGAASHPI